MKKVVVGEVKRQFAFSRLSSYAERRGSYSFYLQ